jgi:hypothetical protein
MLFKEIIAVCSESHKKPINMCGQNEEFLLLMLVVPIDTTVHLRRKATMNILIKTRSLINREIMVMTKLGFNSDQLRLNSI